MSVSWPTAHGPRTTDLDRFYNSNTTTYYRLQVNAVVLCSTERGIGAKDLFFLLLSCCLINKKTYTLHIYDSFILGRERDTCDAKPRAEWTSRSEARASNSFPSKNTFTREERETPSGGPPPFDRHGTSRASWKNYFEELKNIRDRKRSSSVGGKKMFFAEFVQKA